MLTFDVDLALELPTAQDLAVAVAAAGKAGAEGSGAITVTASDPVTVTALYLDTPDHLLFGAGIEIWRQSGGSDDGWYLAADHADGSRGGVRAPLGRSERTVPLRLRRLVWATTRGAALNPVLVVTTVSEMTELTHDDAHVATITIERASARPPTAAEGAAVVGTDPADPEVRPVAWCRVVADVVADHSAADVSRRIDRQLRRLGATRSSFESPLALGLDGAALGRSAVKIAAKAKPRLSPDSGGGNVILSYIAREVSRVQRHDLDARLDAADGIHQMRVATRRLRAALTSFGDLFERDVARHLTAELKWLAGELGRARDAEVLRLRLLAGVSGDGPSLAPGILTGIDRDSRRHQRAAFSATMTALDSERYQLLVAALDEFVATPLVTKRAQRTARKQLRPSVDATLSAVRDALVAAESSVGTARNDALHEARKAAKRARYAAEAVTPAFGKDARAFAKAMERLQEVLGDHQDSVVMQGRLHDLALESSAPLAFAYGVLHERERDRQARLEPLIGRASAASTKKSLRRWLE